MGQRLNIEVKADGKVQANCYYHWSAYTESAKHLATLLIASSGILKNISDKRLLAIKLFECTGATMCEEDRALSEKLYPDEQFRPGADRDDGLIGISEISMNENRLYEEGRIVIDLDNQGVEFHVWDIWDYEEYKKECADNETEMNVQTVDRNPTEMDFQYFLTNFAAKNHTFEHYLYNGLVFCAIA